MLQRLLALSSALLLTACMGSTRTPPPLAYSPPLPPPVATEPCKRTPIHRNADGSLSSAQAEQAMRARDVDLALCEAKRRAAIELAELIVWIKRK